MRFAVTQDIAELCRSRVILAVGMVLFLAGCATSDLAVPTAKFAESVGHSADTVQFEFTSELSYWQQAYIQIHAINGKPIDEPFLEGKKKRDDEPQISFSADAIALRVKIIDGIKNYADALGRLAGGAASADLVANGQRLSADLTSLVGAAAPDDKTFGQYAGPLTTIATWCGREYMDGQRDKAIAAAVQSAGPSFQKIVDQLKVDLGLLKDDKVGIVHKLLSLRIHQFKEASDNHQGEQQLLDIGHKILELEAANQELAHYAALDTIDAWGQAHAAILNYLKSPQKPEDLASLSAEVDAFSGKIQPLVQAYAELRKAK